MMIIEKSRHGRSTQIYRQEDIPHCHNETRINIAWQTNDFQTEQDVVDIDNGDDC